jgi:dephospho-CoA kinase
MHELADTDRVVVLDVPLMVESRNAFPVAGLLVVDVDPEVALQRVVEQRGMRAEDVRARMARQATRQQRLARADRVIDNGGTLDDLRTQVDDAWAWITALPRD